MEKNCVTVKPDTHNYLMPQPTPSQRTTDFDIILMGDMFYDPDFAQLITDWLTCLPRDSTVLIGDPGRLPFMQHPLKSRLKHLHQYSLSKTSQLENNGLTAASIWQFYDPR